MRDDTPQHPGGTGRRARPSRPPPGRRSLREIGRQAALALLLAACGPQTAAERGQALFQDPALSVSPSNLFSCATCHATTVQSDSERQQRRYSGPSLAGATTRSPLWCGRYTYLLDAVNTCLTTFMRGQDLPQGDDSGRAVLAYLQGLPTGPGPGVCTIVRNINDSYLASLPAGDAGRGAGLYAATCAPCHGDLHSGAGRLGARVSLIPEDTLSVFGPTQARAVIAEKIRHGKFYSIGGDMPPYTLETLSDAELADLLRFVLP